MNSVAAVLFLGYLSCVQGVRQNILDVVKLDAIAASSKASKICCCEINGDEATKCYWQQKACNAWYKFYKQRQHVVGVASDKLARSRGPLYLKEKYIFDFGPSEDINKNEVYGGKCVELSGPIQRNQHNDKYVINGALFPKSNDAPAPSPVKGGDEVVVEPADPPVVVEPTDPPEVVEPTDPPLVVEPTDPPVDKEDDDDGDDGPSDEEEPELPSNGDLKDAIQPPNKKWCRLACDSWPPPLGRQTPKKGCHSPLREERFSNADKYCKKVCKPEEGCTTPA